MASLIKQIDGRSVRTPPPHPAQPDQSADTPSPQQIHQLQSGQVINDGLSSAVKELVENALDAHAMSMEIRFKNYGLDSVEVADNGDGISSENYESIGKNRHTDNTNGMHNENQITRADAKGFSLFASLQL